MAELRPLSVTEGLPIASSVEPVGHSNPIARKLVGAVMTGVVAAGSFATLEATDTSAAKAIITQDTPYNPATGNYPDLDAVPTGAPGSFVKNGSEYDSRSYAYRNCTAYAAWRAVEEGLVTSPTISSWGDAKLWDTAASSRGFTVDNTPEVGDLAQWEEYPNNQYGHVAFVEEVRPDGTVIVADYNKTSEVPSGTFHRRPISPSAATPPRHYPDHFIDLNGPNSTTFKLKLHPQGIPAQLSIAEQQANEQRRLEAARSREYQKLFEEIPKDRSIRSTTGNWYLRKGNTLQWVVSGDAGATAVGINSKRYGADKQYTDDMIHTKELGYTFPYTQRDKDKAADKLGPVVQSISVGNIASAAQALGFDSTVQHVSGQGAKGWRFTKNGVQYDVNMDLVAMLATGRTDVFAYPEDWQDGAAWKAHTIPARYANYLGIPFSDLILADYLSLDDLPAYQQRLDYLKTAVVGEPCITPGTICAWGQDSTIANIVGRPYLPATVGELTDIKGVAVAYDAPWETTTYALKEDGTVLSWGANKFGELGNGTIGDKTYEPAVVAGLSDVKSISASFRHVYALKNDGTVWRWGSNLKSKPGGSGVVTVTDTVPTQFTELSNITSLAITESNGYALKSDGTVWAWGTASRGRLGNETDRPNGTSAYTAIPIKVKYLTGVTAIAAHGMNAYALKSNGTVWAWGVRNTYDGGALGDGQATPTSAVEPVQVIGLTGVIDLSATTDSHAGYALKNDGTVWAWGQGANGELGDNRSGFENGTSGAGHYRTVPSQVLNLSGVATIDASPSSGFATKTDGTVWAWGANFRATLGNGPAPEITNPQGDILTIPARITSFTGGRAITGAFGAIYMIVN